MLSVKSINYSWRLELSILIFFSFLSEESMLLYSRGCWILLKDYRGEYKYKIIEKTSY